MLTPLSDAEWSKWSDNAIAKACRVSDKTVARHRQDYLRNSEDSGTRLVERGGTTYEQDTTNIGKPAAGEIAAPKGAGTPTGAGAAEKGFYRLWAVACELCKSSQ